MAAIRQLYAKSIAIAERCGTAPRPRAAGRAGRPADDRRPDRRRDAEPHGADRADGDAQLRQLHVHAHGERLDPDHGAGARARDRRPPAARVRAVGADARHRQGQHAEGHPEQARMLTDEEFAHHAPPRGGRRGDSAAHARDARPGAGRRIRASSPARRHRVSIRRGPGRPQSRDHALQHRRRLRCDAVAAGLPGRIPDRPDSRGAQTGRRQPVRPAPHQTVRAAAGRVSRRHPGQAEVR